MTKRLIRKASHKAIFKEGKSHNATFLEMKSQTDWDDDSLADLISGIPSKEKHAATRSVWSAYLAILGLIILLRIFHIYVVVQELGSNISPIIILPLILVSVIIPAYGIYSVLTGMRHALPVVAILMVVGIFRGLRSVNFQIDWNSIVVFSLIGALIILTIILWNKWKTPYTKQVDAQENGEKKQLRYQFEDLDKGSTELLDDSF